MKLAYQKVQSGKFKRDPLIPRNQKQSSVPIANLSKYECHIEENEIVSSVLELYKVDKSKIGDFQNDIFDVLDTIHTTMFRRVDCTEKKKEFKKENSAYFCSTCKEVSLERGRWDISCRICGATLRWRTMFENINNDDYNDHAGVYQNRDEMNEISRIDTGKNIMYSISIYCNISTDVIDSSINIYRQILKGMSTHKPLVTVTAILMFVLYGYEDSEIKGKLKFNREKTKYSTLTFGCASKSCSSIFSTLKESKYHRPCWRSNEKFELPANKIYSKIHAPKKCKLGLRCESAKIKNSTSFLNKTEINTRKLSNIQSKLKELESRSHEIQHHSDDVIFAK